MTVPWMPLPQAVVGRGAQDEFAAGKLQVKEDFVSDRLDDLEPGLQPGQEGGCFRPRRPEVLRTQADGDGPAVRTHADMEEIHGRAAQKTGHKEVVRMLLERHRRVDLPDLAVTQQDDTLAQRHRFDLVVGDIDHDRSQAPVKPGDLHPHGEAKFSKAYRKHELKISVIVTTLDRTNRQSRTGLFVAYREHANSNEGHIIKSVAVLLESRVHHAAMSLQ